MKTLLETFHSNQMTNAKKLRLALNLKGYQFAKLLGVSAATVSSWENGKCPAHVDKLCELLLNQIEQKEQMYLKR